MKKGSIQRKLAAVFGTIIVSIMLFLLIFYMKAAENMRKLTYEKMQAQAEYYQNNFQTELDNILRLQIDFFANQKLIFLTGDTVYRDDYERREALLSVQERIETIAGTSKIVRNVILYSDKAGYKVTPDAIRKINEADRQELDKYLLNNEGEYLCYDGDEFYFLKAQNEENDFVLVITISADQIEKNLALLNSSEKSGAFLYHEQENVMLESGTAECTGREILGKLQKDGEGNYLNVQRVKSGNDFYLVSVGNGGGLGTFVQYVEENTIMEFSRSYRIYLAVFLAAMLILSAVFVLYTKKMIHKPMQLLLNAFDRVKVGNMQEHIHHNKNDEFYYLYEQFNDMEDRLSSLIQEVYVQKNLTQKAQLRQLQAQINPHFLYNSFFTLNRCIKMGDYEDAKLFTKHLGNYFRFLTRNESDDIALGQEVEHAKSYAAIQQLRFEDRIELQFGDLPEEYAGRKVPRLILQPLLENVFKHGLENRVSGGILRVSFIPSGSGKLKICVEDNGEEASDEVIMSMNQRLTQKEPEEVTALPNIHRRLQYYFREKAGLSVERSSLGGAAVILFIEWEE